jgi:hypothetical protein
MSKQEIFNQVWGAFVIEKAPPSKADDGEGCAYRNGTGGRCAIGLLIPDEVYDPAEMEGINAKHLARSSTKAGAFLRQLCVDIDCAEFLVNLQSAHDNATDEDDFHSAVEARLVGVAEKYDLAVPERATAC